MTPSAYQNPYHEITELRRDQAARRGARKTERLVLQACSSCQQRLSFAFTDALSEAMIMQAERVKCH
jgi:hypothetical protein